MKPEILAAFVTIIIFPVLCSEENLFDGINIDPSIDINDLLMSPSTQEENEFQMNVKNILLGQPGRFLMETFNKICSATMAIGVNKLLKQPKIEDMNLVLFTNSGNISFPLLESQKLWNHEKFDKLKKTVVIVTGWKSNIKSENAAVDTLWEAYKTRSEINFVFVDTAEYVDTLYSWSAFNTAWLGKELAKGLVDLANVVPLTNIHLVGHSLGAQISGAAGRKFQQLTNKTLPRITGLDPAKPCFKGGEDLQALGRGDAEFVDIIHSNSGCLGKETDTADADFYPNGIVPLMPGCLAFSCSHSKSWQYYAESVYKGHENNFLSKKCQSFESYEKDDCIGGEIPMGFACPTNIKGTFYLTTEDKSLFGVGQRSDKSFANSNCPLKLGSLMLIALLVKTSARMFL